MDRQKMLKLLGESAKISKADVAKALKPAKFRPDRARPDLMRRLADVAPGIVVHEFKPVKIIKGVREASGTSTYTVVVYLGTPGERWRNSGEVDSIDKAVVYAATYADRAAEAWRKDRD